MRHGRRRSRGNDDGADSPPRRGRAGGKRVAVVAVGGHAFDAPGERTPIETRRARIGDTCQAIAEMVREGWRVVVTHGNGPRVGAAVGRAEQASPTAYRLSLDLCVASTQGEMGLLWQQELGMALDARRLPVTVATVVSQVVVSPTDEAFAHPSTPIGAALTPAEAAADRVDGWTIVDDSALGLRRAVASPEPLDVIEEPAIRTLVDAGFLVIALGGGGVPVVRQGTSLRGVAAVVDKDLSSALLAIQLEVALLAIVTDVDGIHRDFGTPEARLVREVTAEDLRRYAAEGHFPAGTMGPKVEAVLRFVEAGGPEALVTSPGRLIEALEGRAGTRVVAEVPGRWRRRRARAERSSDRWIESGS